MDTSNYHLTLDMVDFESVSQMMDSNKCGDFLIG